MANALVLGIPARREEVLKNLAAARERKKEADTKLSRLLVDANASEEEVWEANRERWRASGYVNSAQQDLGSDDLDPENRKAVARQMAGLVREESWQRLNALAARSDDPEVRRTVSEYKEEVRRATYQLITRFREARPLERDEVNKCRAEAQAILDRL